MSYTQSPPLTKKEIEDFCSSAKVIRICTHNEDGTIHAVPVWFNYKNGHFIIKTPEKTLKVRNLMRDNRLTLLLDKEIPPGKGVIIYGTAEVEFEEEEIKEGTTYKEGLELLEKYMSKEEAEKTFAGFRALTDWVTITVIPERVVSYDFAKDDKHWNAVAYTQFVLYTRPDRITDEEVIFHIEKKICLVCKKEILKFTYVCPECEIFYCMNCSQALANLENVCWVCNTPIDESKSSKPFEIEKYEKKMKKSKKS
ncbi:MAG: pyridoxamine 5'-phosphate oxidase family protein [Promethearchaeota archaeon]|nr:MAG: pyridoxamine 5'-phosphate oxidase family protein [Candidatus Lokiarchaeota archaeon]